MQNRPSPASIDPELPDRNQDPWLPHSLVSPKRARLIPPQCESCPMNLVDVTGSSGLSHYHQRQAHAAFQYFLLAKAGPRPWAVSLIWL